MADDYHHRVLLVEDEEFTRTLVAGSLTSSGLEVRGVSTVTAAVDLLESFEPHVVMADLDLGPGPSGADLLTRVAAEQPWVGLVVLTAHESPELALPKSSNLPDRVVYLVKSHINSVGDLQSAVESALIDAQPHATAEYDQHGKVVLTQPQAEILRLIAEGYSNAGIAQQRGTTLRSAESLVRRTFHALGLESNPAMNPRVLAVRMWQQGRVVVR